MENRKVGPKIVSVRVSASPYYAAIFFVLFVSAFLLFIELNIAGIAGLLIAAIVLPLLAFFDRIRFDGLRLYRTGPVPRLFARLVGTRTRLRLSHIEHIETRAIRALRFRGRVVYVNRTAVRGRDVTFTFAAGGDRYLGMVLALFPAVPEDVLDNRSIELRDYLADGKQVLANARRSRIPSADVLESSMEQVRSGKGLLRPSPGDAAEDPSEKLQELRCLANQLRVTGSLRQAAEAFRRALLLRPPDGWLLYEFAKCLHSLAGAERDNRLERRARAMLRLAEKRAGDDPKLLSRLGDSYHQIGDWKRAASAFRRTKDSVGEGFRSLRGLAEIALREGKIAHVIHNFAEANRLTAIHALRRWTNAEVEYFSRLNDNDEYMELEISRVNLVDKLTSWRRKFLLAVAVGLPVIVVGVVLNDGLLANLGWALSGTSIVLWVVAGVLERMLSARIPIDLVERGD